MKLLCSFAAALVATSVAAQYAPAPSAEPRPAQPAAASAPTGANAKSQDAATLKSLAWLEGCWRGTAGPREFREQWMPLRGAMMLGVSQTVDEKGATQAYEFLRLEPRPGGVFYVATPSGKGEVALKFDGETTDTANERTDAIFTFVNPKQEFPQVIAYRRAKGGWLYASVEGKVAGADRKATYPMRRINCETGDLVER
jgi:hypothetical protein